jgi:uncharacterized protein (DUF1778 family)
VVPHQQGGRTKSITVRLTAEEDALVTAGARLQGISKSDYLRDRLREAVARSFAHAGKLR